MRILTIFGTRPEAIKLAPVVRAFEAMAGIAHATCVTGQHRQMLDQVLQIFQLTPQYDLDLMAPRQALDQMASRALAGIGGVIDSFRPDWVIVQGDTITAFAGALAAFYRNVSVAHVEAGLRTGNARSPWPEEMNRRLISQLASMHFPPTEWAADNLRREHVPEERLRVTGNTVIDALQWAASRLEQDKALRLEMNARFSFIDSEKRLILVTGHRRENLEGALERVCRALLRLSVRQDVEIVYPVHLNPQVRETARNVLGSARNIHLIEPLDYLPFVSLMQRAHLIVTDSGGIQEEAPALGKPVLVTRDTSERPEAIAAGTARLVGTDEAELTAAINELLDNEEAYQRMARAHSPYGDGKAAEHIVECLVSLKPDFIAPIQERAARAGGSSPS